MIPLKCFSVVSKVDPTFGTFFFAYVTAVPHDLLNLMRLLADNFLMNTYDAEGMEIASIKWWINDLDPPYGLIDYTDKRSLQTLSRSITLCIGGLTSSLR